MGRSVVRHGGEGVGTMGSHVDCNAHGAESVHTNAATKQGLGISWHTILPIIIAAYVP